MRGKHTLQVYFKKSYTYTYIRGKHLLLLILEILYLYAGTTYIAIILLLILRVHNAYCMHIVNCIFAKELSYSLGQKHKFDKCMKLLHQYIAKG